MHVEFYIRKKYIVVRPQAKKLKNKKFILKTTILTFLKVWIHDFWERINICG